MSSEIRVGDTVLFRRGLTKIGVGLVVGIERCQRQGDLYGEEVAAIDWNDKRFGVFMLTDGRYCFGSDIEHAARIVCAPPATIRHLSYVQETDSIS